MVIMAISVPLTSAQAAKKGVSESIQESLRDISDELSRMGEIIHEKSDDAAKKIPPAVKEGWEKTKKEAGEVGEKIGSTTEKGVVAALEAISSTLQSLREKLERDKKQQGS